MATLYVTEFSGLSMGWNGGTIPTDGLIQIAAAPALANQIVSMGSGASTPSGAFTGTTHIIRVISDTTCWIDIGTTPAATNAKMLIVANSPEYFGVRPGDKIAVISG